MARIKKKGLDYFPINTDFIHDRAVRRLMKREGDGSLGILLEVLSYIYSGEGYYVYADRFFYEDLSAGMYETSAEDIERTIRLAVEYGLFHSGLFSQYSILTSAEIQQQYLFSTRRRNESQLDATYCLLSSEELTKKTEKDDKENKEDKETDKVTENNVTLIPENVTPSTHSKTKNSKEKDSKAKERKEYPLLNPPLKQTGEEAKKEEEREEEGIFSIDSGERKEWTQEAINKLCPPTDGIVRNFSGLLDNLRAYKIPPSEQYAIIRKSNFGAIGGTIWKGLCALRSSNGSIKLPGRYLLSIVNKKVDV